MSSGQPQHAADDQDAAQLLLLDIARVALIRAGAEDWTTRRSTLWCLLEPPEHAMRPHGWKLHVSATQLSAPIVLARSAPVLIEAGCPFKFARSLDFAGRMGSRNAERGGGGKFLTAYPDDDEQFRRLADRLHQVTYGLPGPGVLSDRPYRTGGVVYYRYGGFRGSTLGNDGCYETSLVGPDGTAVRDVRRAWFSPPPWAGSPLAPLGPDGTEPATRSPSPATANRVSPTQGPATNGTAAARPVLLGGRFLVRDAIRHSYRGGVYRAVDQRTGEQVVVKQARRHADADLTGADAQDALRNEADVLRRLAGQQLAPRLVELFAQQDDLFLAEEFIPGAHLHWWRSDQLARTGRQETGLTLAEITRMAGLLTEALAAVHATGLVHRDFNPFNVMVTEDESLRLVDLEMSARPGRPVGRIVTFGYTSPEQRNGALVGPAPAQTSDLYSLGATICYLTTGIDPVLLRDEPTERPMLPRIAALLDLAEQSLPVTRRLRPLILGLTDDDPARRWPLSRVREFLAELDRQPEPAATITAGPPTRPPTASPDRLISDGLDFLLDTMTPNRNDRLWRSGPFGMTTDACAVQHGAAGVLSVLTLAATARPDERLRRAVADAARWIGRQLPAEPRVLPGLYFGRSGTAWALHDAARLLTDDVLADQALELALRIPTGWPNPDVCHGTAGAGLAQLHLWQVTGDERCRQRMLACADHLVEVAERTGDEVMWPVPDDFPSELAGVRQYGFGHGVAGVGTFLLAAAELTGRADYHDLALLAGHTLARNVEVDPAAASWPGVNQAQPNRRMVAHWCSGSSGIGTFLIRLWQNTGEDRFGELARQAAVTVRRSRFTASPAACHGLAGDGHFLLDLADALDEPRYRDWAEEFADWMGARAALRDGRLLLPDETLLDVVADFHTGLSGAVGYLLRLRHGGPRPFLPAAPAVGLPTATGTGAASTTGTPALTTSGQTGAAR
ncbi:class IV lanthionine synthetase LanL [Micromonospora eburnea]|uniref:non-specific serine/threonine protein kinase n=1 Tax=Micromonospora eburnea TaxID=227316 RepID=A0A1C6UWI9_9ACTN|nr:class IV lanthionine synthetase LanL [Micromonospora eburnea]SCL58442.1 Protein kinase domain-containing protein [Micromonospora eburnea]